MKRIHTLTKALGMDREAYEDLLHTTWKVTSSTQLSTAQRTRLIAILTRAATKAGVWKQMTPKSKPTQSALRRLRYHSLFCAIHKATMPPFEMEDGRTMEGEPLRTWLKERFDQVGRQPQREGVIPIPSSILRYLSTTYINPLLNKWLDDEPKPTLYLHELRKEEVQYLTTRMKEFQRVIEQESPAVDTPFTTNTQPNEKAETWQN